MQADALAAVLGDRGWLSDVVVNRTTGHILDGHLRVELALARGEPSVPVTYVEIAEGEEPLVLATFDPIGALATTDSAALDALLREVVSDDPAIAQLLETVAQEAGLSFARAGLTDPDELPPEPAEADVYVRRGDLWILGDHRILCGDATDADAVARLLDGAQPRLLATDPPYGVQLDQTWRDDVYNTAGRLGAKAYPATKPYIIRDAADGQADGTHASAGAHRRTAGHRNITISGDVRADWSEAFALVPSLQAAYVWYASAHTLEVLQGLLAIGFELVQQVIWDKGKFAISRQWYHWEHEPCFVVRKPGVPNLFIGKDHTQSTIWRVPSPKQIGSGSHEEKQDHPTQKPVLLFEIPIANHLRPGEAVYEPFSGSGTTIIAAETLGRRCYAMEIDPKYVQIAIERWSRHTGREGVRAQ
jgi:DNA modification methylase